jgi:hypothetical protein
MAWEYLHFKDKTESAMRREAPPNDDETPLQAFLNVYGRSNYELVYVGRPSTTSYELIFKIASTPGTM